ncbi:hypothetical protein D3C86_1663400 [compost metagenome]
MFATLTGQPRFTIHFLNVNRNLHVNFLVYCTARVVVAFVGNFLHEVFNLRTNQFFSLSRKLVWCKERNTAWGSKVTYTTEQVTSLETVRALLTTTLRKHVEVVEDAEVNLVTFRFVFLNQVEQVTITEQ